MRIHYFAAARAAAGLAEEDVEALPTLELLLADAAARHPDLQPILDRCTILIDGQRATPDASLTGASRVDVLPPFAGG
ncbi:molybdopterin synthase sulfur carrier subunit [Corynebacterium sp. HMSC30G07]|uniref:MoaD/ThiS family protein n=1 Tax=Corynebacterium sp. HMSC30G07 TaxID=1581072 RepID=UPI0008A48FEF|nr:MoaD/ThiS family protein [Corynebacterium sp. HMSC30G07]OFT74856.1 molybdopterin synthase sulfur carrier subunit [Corynebacterium sp. HMSC30G07]